MVQEKWSSAGFKTYGKQYALKKLTKLIRSEEITKEF